MKESMNMYRLNRFMNVVSRTSITKFVLFLLVLPVLLAACGATDDGGESASGETQLYTCGMHPNVIQEGPGNCPICGMKLTPILTESKAMATAEHEHAGSETAMESGSSDISGKEAAKDKKILYWRAPMDPTHIADKPGKSPMGMDLIPVYEGEEASGGSTISIDPVTVQNIGIRTAEVKLQPFNRVIRTVGHIDYDEQSLYNINIKFSGWIEKLFVDRTGDWIKKGQPLFEIYSPELVATQEEYLLAYKNRLKLQNSEYGEVSSGAESLLKATQKRLKYWDISDEEVQNLERTGEIRKTLTIYSPANGIVVHKNAINGTFIKAGQNLFRIADISTVWVYAHIFEYEIAWIKVGQKALMELPYIPGRQFEGEVDYIYPYLDQKTRDVKIRLVFKNQATELKPEMYASITIESSFDNAELVIPSEAIIRTGKRNVVFIDLGNGKFRPQDIIVGPEGDNAMIQVIAGLDEGQKIVTSAQFLLDSESRLREAIQKMLEARKTAM
jgi:Cu(I)/Ag(I) efflux system membrane fusion protein/cobalt-zinc-cadmium efflux system membrane fusion protein